jgi:adenosylmethionine-8-amino-7-oxononanoate aminotransferase
MEIVERKNIKEIVQADREHVLHPNLPIGSDANIVIESGNGIWLKDIEGKEYIDGRSQLTSVNLGYGNKEIIDAIKTQLDKLQYLSIFYQFTHTPIVEFASQLSKITPVGLSHFIFTSGGSEAVENALMVARLYWNKMKKPKFKVISQYMAYHGNTTGTMALTGIPMGGIESIISTMPGFIHIPPYYCYRCSFELEYPKCKIKCARYLGEIIEKEGPDSVSAFIAEPVIGVGGYIAPPSEYWPIVRQICDKYDVLLIGDEVMTGFCRTGKMFALQNWGVVPDLMPMGKGINSCYIPFGGVAISDKIYEKLEGEHISGHTHSGHPLAAAAASKTIEIYQRDKIADHVAQIAEQTLDRLNMEFLTLPCVADVNVLGLMIGIEVVRDKKTKEPLHPKIMSEILPNALAQGLITRGRGTRIALCPPLIITAEEMTKVLDIIYGILSKIKP